tara:strand:- start:269 stop:1195 length:927 start_codon:yes stop_codon:yes gene_type:complete
MNLKNRNKTHKKIINTNKDKRTHKVVRKYKSKTGGSTIVIMFKNYQKTKTQDPTSNKTHLNTCQCLDYQVEKSKNSLMDKDIEYKKCKEPIVKGSNFCVKHQNCMGYLRKYTNGYEPKYQPADWSHPYVEGSHNCYAYFLNDKKDSIESKCEELCLKNNKKGCPQKDSDCQDLIPQPGDYYLLSKYGNTKKKETIYSCPNMHNKILSDNPELLSSRLLEKCPANHYKGAMVVDPGNTFHFYRQNPNGTWSHKPGILPIANIDASKRDIAVPHFANRDYSKIDDSEIKYTDFCGYYCIPVNSYFETSLS